MNKRRKEQIKEQVRKKVAERIVSEGIKEAGPNQQKIIQALSNISRLLDQSTKEIDSIKAISPSDVQVQIRKMRNNIIVERNAAMGLRAAAKRWVV